MTKEEIEELIGLAAGMGLYDDKNPGKRAVILGKAIKELQQEPCKDAISRQEMLKYFEGWKNQIKYYHPYAKNFDIPYEEAIQSIKDVPPVKCVSSEELCEDSISRQAVLNTLENMDNALDEDRTVESYKELLRECYKVLPSVSSSVQRIRAVPVDVLNHWIGAEVLDRIRNEMHATSEKHEDGVYYLRDEWVDEIIDKYAEEDKA